MKVKLLGLAAFLLFVISQYTPTKAVPIEAPGQEISHYLSCLFASDS